MSKGQARADALIIGAGPTGAVAAKRLAEAGMRVVVLEQGDWPDYARARADRLVLKPTNVTFEQACAVPTSAITALQAVRNHGNVQPGQKVLIIGASGGVGLFAVQIARASGAEVTAGGAVAHGPDDITRASAQAQDVVRLARVLERPPGGYLLRDVLLEYQLTRPSDAQGDLAQLLDPIDRNPDLPLTLEVYLDHDLDRRRTAAALHVHPTRWTTGCGASSS